MSLRDSHQRDASFHSIPQRSHILQGTSAEDLRFYQVMLQRLLLEYQSWAMRLKSAVGLRAVPQFRSQILGPTQHRARLVPPLPHHFLLVTYCAIASLDALFTFIASVSGPCSLHECHIVFIVALLDNKTVVPNTCKLSLCVRSWRGH